MITVRTRVPLALIWAILIFGCATAGDPQTDYYNPFRGGGYVDFELEKGLFRVEVKSDSALFGSLEVARTRWRQRAEELCKESNVREFGIRERSYEIRRSGDKLDEDIANILPQFKIAVRTGYALCPSAPVSVEDARLTVQKKGWQL